MAGADFIWLVLPLLSTGRQNTEESRRYTDEAVFLRSHMSDKKRKAAAIAVAEDESESIAKDTELPTNEELARLLAKKESLESSLSNLERQIYALETSYLEDTYAVGNLLRVRGITAHCAIFG